MQYLWERAMPAKNHRHELGVPARSYGIGGTPATATLQSLQLELNRFLGHRIRARLP